MVSSKPFQYLCLSEQLLNLLTYFNSGRTARAGKKPSPKPKPVLLLRERPNRSLKELFYAINLLTNLYPWNSKSHEVVTQTRRISYEKVRKTQIKQRMTWKWQTYTRCLQGWEMQAHRMITVGLNVVFNKLMGLDFKTFHVSILKLNSTTIVFFHYTRYSPKYNLFFSSY